jgi:hypothetical protein
MQNDMGNPSFMPAAGPASHVFARSRNPAKVQITYTEIRSNRRRCLALTGLTPAEFEQLLITFERCYEGGEPSDRTADGRPRQRFPGGGRTGALHLPGQKLLFVLVYLKDYPLQALMAELFGLSQPRVNAWLRRLLPILREALEVLGVRPERDPDSFATTGDASGARTKRIIDGTERRRQRPKNREKQAASYSGRKKVHCDKNLVVVRADSRRVEYLSQTYAGRTADKGMADCEGIAYPPGTVLYKDTGFQGYEPAVTQTCQARKKAARRRVERTRETGQSQVGPGAGARGTRISRGQALSHRQRRATQHAS